MGGYAFVFADYVSERMKAVYDHSDAIRTKVLALRSLMIAADQSEGCAPEGILLIWRRSRRSTWPCPSPK